MLRHRMFKLLRMDVASASSTYLSILLPGSGHWDGSVADWPGHKFTVSASRFDQICEQSCSRWLLAVGGTRRYLQLSACQVPWPKTSGIWCSVRRAVRTTRPLDEVGAVEPAQAGETHAKWPEGLVPHSQTGLL